MDMITHLSSLILWLDILGGVEKIIITGKITYLEDFFWKELRRVIKNNLLIKEKEIEIIKREYSENIILKGALRYGIDNFINSKYFKSIMKESEKVAFKILIFSSTKRLNPFFSFPSTSIKDSTTLSNPK